MEKFNKFKHHIIDNRSLCSIKGGVLAPDFTYVYCEMITDNAICSDKYTEWANDAGERTDHTFDKCIDGGSAQP